MGELPDINDFDLANLPEAFYDNLYPYYQALREREPIKQLNDGSFLLTRYADILHVYKRPDLFSSDKKKEFYPKYGDSPLFEHHTTSLVFNDPPLHTRVRRLISGAMHPSALKSMEAGLVQCIEDLLDRMAGRNEVDLIEDFAMLIPIEIIGNMLAIPHNERGPLRDWSLAILGALEPQISNQVFQRGNQAVIDFLTYLDDLTARRRAHPGDPEKDVLTRMILGEQGESLNHRELLHNCIFLLNAGHETTTNLIGNALHILQTFPGARQTLLAEPEKINSTVEECLRFESSNQLGNRITTTQTEIDSITLPANSRIHLVIGAANRDPEQFTRPDEFQLDRKPNRHLAFGSGIHQCAGLNLARMEGRIAIARFLRRHPNYQLSGKPRRAGRARFRGFLNLPSRLNPPNQPE